MEEIEEIQQEHDREQFYHDQEQEMQIKEKEMEHERNREHNMALMHQVCFSSIQKVNFKMDLSFQSYHRLKFEINKKEKKE